MIRTFVLMGQFGRVTSAGMVALAERLGKFGETTVHSWDDRYIVQSIHNNLEAENKVAVIGYSLGANQIGFISGYLASEQDSQSPADLAVAYDPSWLSPLVVRSNGQYIQRAPGFRRVLCYRNTGAWVWGGSTYVGQNVEEHSVSNFHLGVQFDEALHKKTIAAVEALK